MSSANGNTAIKLEDQQQQEASLNQQFQSIDWDSERQLVSSLAKLQELESKIHELRSLLPNRLLAPINPIVNPRPTPTSLATTTTTANPIPRNPQSLSSSLRKSAIAGVAEINDFKSLWNSADMQEIWQRVDEKLAETKGAFPQGGAGMWRVDYAEILREGDEKDTDRKEKIGGGGGGVEGDDEVQFPPSLYSTREETVPKTIVESFQGRQIPGFRVASTRNESTIIVSLGLAGLTFEIQEALTTETTTTTTTTTSFETTNTSSTSTTTKPEYRVETRQHLPLSKTAGTTRLETAIVAQLNARPRKWDLRFLLELILSYADIRSLPCKKCAQLTDSAAQLPILRKPVAASAGSGEGGLATGNAGVVWEGYHVGCI